MSRVYCIDSVLETEKKTRLPCIPSASRAVRAQRALPRPADGDPAVRRHLVVVQRARLLNSAPVCTNR